MKKILNRYFILVFFVETLQTTVYQMLNTTMAQFVGNTSLAGVFSSCITVVSLALSLLSGSLLDRYGRKPVLLIGLGISALAMLMCGMLPLIPVYFVCRLIHTAGNSAASSCDGTVVADVSPAERLGEAVGYFGYSQSVSTAVGPALGLTLAGALGYRWLYLVCGVVVCAAFVLGLFCDYEKRGYGTPPAKTAEAPAEQHGILRYIEPAALRPSVVHLIYFIACAVTVYYLASYAEIWSIPHVELFYTASAVGMLIPRLFAGRLADRIGALPVVVCGMAVGAISYLCILLAKSAWALLPVSGVAYGFALGLVTPPLQASAVRAVSAARRGVATSTFFVSIPVGLGLGGALFGFTIDWAGYDVTMAIALALIALSLCLSFLALRKSPSR